MAKKFDAAIAVVGSNKEKIETPKAPAPASSDPSKALSEANVKTAFGTPADTE